MTEPKSYPNARDCEHGSQRGKCVNCDLATAEKRVETLEAALKKVLTQFMGDTAPPYQTGDWLTVTVRAEDVHAIRKALASTETSPNGPWHTPPCHCGRAECQPAKPVLTTSKRWANDPMYTGELEERLAETEAREEELIKRVAQLDVGCFNCGGLPHSPNCAVRDVKALLYRAETAEGDRRCVVERALGGGEFVCDNPVTTKNGFCAEHGAQDARNFKAQRSSASLRAEAAAAERDLLKEELAAWIKTANALRDRALRVEKDQDAALARLNAGGISHGGVLDMGITIALEHFERLNAEVKALKAEAEVVNKRVLADELITISMGKKLDKLKKQLHEEDMTRCDLEADLHTFGKVDVEDGLRAGIFTLIEKHDALKTQKDALVELNKKLQDSAAWHLSRAEQYAAVRDAQATRLKAFNELLDPDVIVRLRDTVERLKTALLARCPKHCEKDHEFGTCELTRREITALAEVK